MTEDRTTQVGTGEDAAGKDSPAGSPRLKGKLTTRAFWSAADPHRPRPARTSTPGQTRKAKPEKPR